MFVKRGYRVEIDLNNVQRTACMKHCGSWHALPITMLSRRKKENYLKRLPTPYAAELHKEINLLKQSTALDVRWRGTRALVLVRPDGRGIHTMYEGVSTSHC